VFTLDSPDARVCDIDKIIIALITTDAMAIRLGRRVLFGRPFSIWLDSNLICIPHFAQDLFHVLIDSQTFIG
jgi:hypothetical protein